MARILFTVPPLVGHLNPALAVARQLAAQGHEVAWAVHAERIGERIPDGMQVLDIGVNDPVNGIDASQVRGLESVRVFFEDYTVPMARACTPQLMSHARTFVPDVMVVDHQMPAGALVARALGLPWVTLVTTTASILKLSDTMDQWVASQYAVLQREFLQADRHVERPDLSPHRVVVFSHQSLMGQLQDCLDAPYEFVGPTQGEGRRQVDFPWSFLKPDTRKVLISLGTVSRDRDTRFFEVFLQAMAQLPDVQAVMVAPSALQAMAPPNVLVRDFVPQVDLLPRLHAVVCHAGHNTVCEALSHGLPLGVAPIRDDQPVVARQVVQAGAGVSIRYGKVTVNTAVQTLKTLLDDPALRQSATNLATHFRNSPGAAGAARSILGLCQTAPV